MKKLLSVVLVCLLSLGLLAACGGGGNAPTGSTADYKEVIESVRNEDMNEYFPIVTSPEEDTQLKLVEFMGLTQDNMQKYAITTSVFITQSYSISIILPAAGKTQDVRDELQNFIDMQKKAMDGYLPDQYAIAQAAIIEEADTGEVILVMTEDATSVMQQIKDELKAGTAVA